MVHCERLVGRSIVWYPISESEAPVDAILGSPRIKSVTVFG